MDIFEYLPQLIVAYDGNDKFANLIHVKKADKDKDYFCPCCGGNVKSRTLESTKEQSHYFHVTGKCTRESQLHFFCKNWLFDAGSKFYLGGVLYEVDFIDIEKPCDTPFGVYKPDVTVHTTIGKEIYFEMFFTNRKTGDDYFCKWDHLRNDVVEVNIKEYMSKTDENSIPTFTYLYHDGVCYSKPYVKRDLYANTIAKIKRELNRQKILNYKARIEQLDWFWQEVRDNKPKNDILKVVAAMEYDDMISCYEIIKRKQCVSYLKDDVLNLINQKVVSDVRNELNLPYDENVYFDLEHVKGRTYKAGIRLNLKTDHIIYNSLYLQSNYWGRFDSLMEYPKIVFSKNIFDKREIVISDKNRQELNGLYHNVCEIRDNLLKHENDISDFEKGRYKVKMNNDLYTVLVLYKDKTEVLFEDRHISPCNIENLSNEISSKIVDNENDKFLKTLLCSGDYIDFMQKIMAYKNFNININIGKANNNIRLKMYIGHKCLYNEKLCCIDDFNKKKHDCISMIHDFMEKYSVIVNLVNMINNCKNNFWKSEISDYFGNDEIVVTIDQKYFVPKRYATFEKIYFDDALPLETEYVISQFKKAMYKIMDNMEYCGYRVMEVRNEE